MALAGWLSSATLAALVSAVAAPGGASSPPADAGAPRATRAIPRGTWQGGPRQPRADAAQPHSRGTEWMAGAGSAWSMDLLQSRGGRQYVPVTLSWGRDLTLDGGPGVLRGRLMWAAEVMPLYWQRAPTKTAGVGVSPLVWRWRFVPRRRAAAFAELAVGGLFTADPVPEGTEAGNFLAHGGFGLRWRPAARVALVTAYRFQHISNGNQRATNPGVNAHIVQVGVSVTR